MNYIDTPKNIDKLVVRLKNKATLDGQMSIALKFANLKNTTIYNLPYQLNKIVSITKDYQLILIDGDVQDLLDSINTVYWFNYLKKINQLVKLTETIEAT